MIKIKKYNNRLVQLTVIFYILTIYFNMLIGVDNFRLTFLMRVRFIYLFLLILYFLSTFYGILPKKPILVLSLLLLHTVLFGVIFVNPGVIGLIRENFREMMIYISLISLTCYFVWHQQLFDDFMQWSYWVTALVLLRCGLTHISHFVNPLYFVYITQSTHGYRTTFGFGHANFTGNICVFALIYSVFIMERLRNGKSYKALLKDRYIRVIISIDIIIGEMLFSTQSRTSILAGLIFAFAFSYFHWKDLFHLTNRIRIFMTYLGIILMVLFIAFFGGGVWAEANRAENFNTNYPIFKRFSPFTGMGFVPPYGFLTDAFRLGTFALDIYYLYIFFSTGYIGSAIILVFLILTLVFSLQIQDVDKRGLSISLYVAMLITGVGQTNMVMYTLMPTMINWTILCLQMCPKPIDNSTP